VRRQILGAGGLLIIRDLLEYLIEFHEVEGFDSIWVIRLIVDVS